MFQLAQPWILLLLLLPVLIRFLLPQTTTVSSAALNVPFFQELKIIADREKFRPGSVMRTGFFLLIWSLMVLAAAGPQWVGDPLPLTREGRNIMMVLDLSGSMELDDMVLNNRRVTRLAVVKKAAEQFVKERIGDHLGLILFGSRAYLQTPLTFDRQNVLLQIKDATAGLAGNTTSLGDALGLAVKRLQNVPSKSRIVILLTDGANTSGILLPLKAAELARDDQIKVYTIGLGSEPSSVVNDGFYGMRVSADLDEETLLKIAETTGGQYFRATDAQTLQRIYDTINQLETIKQDQALIRPQQDYYSWPLALALLLFMSFCGKSLSRVFRSRTAAKRSAVI